jgi:hypothetical protein
MTAAGTLIAPAQSESATAGQLPQQE